MFLILDYLFQNKSLGSAASMLICWNITLRFAKSPKIKPFEPKEDKLLSEDLYMTFMIFYQLQGLSKIFYTNDHVANTPSDLLKN